MATNAKIEEEVRSLIAKWAKAPAYSWETFKEDLVRIAKEADGSIRALEGTIRGMVEQDIDDEEDDPTGHHFDGPAPDDDLAPPEPTGPQEPAPPGGAAK